jgi:hypothetical protein
LARQRRDGWFSEQEQLGRRSGERGISIAKMGRKPKAAMATLRTLENKGVPSGFSNLNSNASVKAHI